jgi:hypothetical protein
MPDLIIEKKELSKSKLDNFLKTKYEVTTVIPYVEKPIIQKRILSKKEIDILLRDYEKYAEFIVEVKKVK